MSDLGAFMSKIKEFGMKISEIEMTKSNSGAEYFVLKGLMPLIEKNAAHLHMIVEICPYGIRKSGAHGLDLLALLEQTGLVFFIIDHIQHGLIATNSDKLADWIKSLDETPENEGFINVLLAPKGSISADTFRLIEQSFL